MATTTDGLGSLLSSLSIMITVISVIVHVIFASAIARDAGNLAKTKRTTYLVSGVSWAFATLIGGVFVAGLYWIMHYSSLARGQSQ